MAAAAVAGTVLAGAAGRAALLPRLRFGPMLVAATARAGDAAAEGNESTQRRDAEQVRDGNSDHCFRPSAVPAAATAARSTAARVRERSGRAVHPVVVQFAQLAIVATKRAAAAIGAEIQTGAAGAAAQRQQGQRGRQ